MSRTLPAIIAQRSAFFNSGCILQNAFDIMAVTVQAGLLLTSMARALKYVRCSERVPISGRRPVRRKNQGYYISHKEAFMSIAVRLKQSFDKLTRYLVIVVILAIIGFLGNGFLMSSFYNREFVAEELQLGVR